MGHEGLVPYRAGIDPDPDPDFDFDFDFDFDSEKELNDRLPLSGGDA